jgi:hypothetical protein
MNEKVNMIIHTVKTKKMLAKPNLFGKHFLFCTKTHKLLF